MTTLSKTFKEMAAPGTGRCAIQLTTGADFCYPMYYFIPSFSSDDRYLVYHRAGGGEVQLHRLDLTTGESVQLTHVSYPHAQWNPWCTDPGRGVLDHRSAVNTVRDEAIYFDDNVVHAVNIRTLADRVLFTLPADRLATGQNCVSPDGQWFAFIHHDRALYESIFGVPGAPRKAGYQYPRHLSRNTKLAAFNLDSGELRTLVIVDAPIHHVQPAGDNNLAFSSLPSAPTILYTDYDGGWYTHLRTRTEEGGNTCHYCATKRGLAYEATGGPHGMVGGMVSPTTHKTVEFHMPSDLKPGYGGHVGFDPDGRLVFYERNAEQSAGVHDLIFLLRHVPGADEWAPLTGNWPCFGGGQKAHLHPRLVLGGQWMLIIAGDPASQSNHMFLLDVSDLPESEGVEI
jgi:hypothetical protein